MIKIVEAIPKNDIEANAKEIEKEIAKLTEENIDYDKIAEKVIEKLQAKADETPEEKQSKIDKVIGFFSNIMRYITPQKLILESEKLKQDKWKFGCLVATLVAGGWSTYWILYTIQIIFGPALSNEQLYTVLVGLLAVLGG